MSSLNILGDADFVIADAERDIFMVLPKTDKNGRIGIGMGYSKWIEETLARSERGERPVKPPIFSRAEPKPTDTARPAAYAVADLLWKTLCDRWKEENDERIRSHQKKQAVGHFNVKTTKTN